MACKHWPCAFRRALVLDQFTTTVNKDKNAIEDMCGNRPLGERLRAWGCCTWARKNGKSATS